MCLHADSLTDNDVKNVDDNDDFDDTGSDSNDIEHRR